MPLPFVNAAIKSFKVLQYYNSMLVGRTAYINHYINLHSEIKILFHFYFNMCA